MKNFCCTVAALGVSAAFLVADTQDKQGQGDILELPVGKVSETLQQTAMPDLGEGRLAKILKRYYTDGLGGSENWEQISSIKMSGTLKLEGGEFELNGYQKKPNLMKMSIRRGLNQVSFGYDGDIAWQNLADASTAAEPMPETEARRFKHSASFGNYLLYPFAAGKKIEYIDTVPNDGDISHQIRVTLDTGYQVDYFIDIRSYLEVKSISTDLRSGVVSSLIYQDHVREGKMPIARQVKSYEDGKWVSTLTLDEVKLNSGVIPWMFKMHP